MVVNLDVKFVMFLYVPVWIFLLNSLFSTACHTKGSIIFVESYTKTTDLINFKPSTTV